jgi:hypothetical protein
MCAIGNFIYLTPSAPRKIFDFPGKPAFHMVTSPPLSPSPIKERGNLIKKRGFAPLKHPCAIIKK